jgi:DNA-3-methyladenine glycosylase II
MPKRSKPETGVEAPTPPSLGTAAPRSRRVVWAEGVEHLRRVDPAWGELIDRVGPCVIRPRRDRFGTLVRAIIGQQISSKAAAAIDGRLRALAGDPHTPRPLLDLGETGLRSVGLSGVKARYVLNLAEAAHSGALPLHRFHRLKDEAIVAHLTAIKGIGVWTAEMFLIFSLARPDVFPVGDLAIRSAMQGWLGLPEMPKPTACRAVAEPWRPYRSVASWYLWRSLEPKHRAPPPAPVAGASNRP